MPIYAVWQLARYLKDSLDSDAFLADLWVQGEVSNASHSAAGHWYFTLKDDRAQLRSVMFRNGGGGRFIQNGAKVNAHGRASFYEARGELQLYVDLVQPEGAGELALKLELLRQKLEREGLFDPSRKRSLPRFPQRIGVATSPSSAAWQDIQNVIRRRFPLVELVLAPCQVQGDAAASTIVEALETLAAEPDLDVLIVARGGGSLEELWPFNEESVARAVFACPVPVISGVGHETDTTICDQVADVRAPTPSAAAELAVPDARELRTQVAAHRQALDDVVAALVERRQRDAEALAARLLHRAPDIAAHRLRVDDLLKAARQQLDGTVLLFRERLNGLSLRLGALDPNAVLRRGYAIVQRKDTAAVVTSAAKVTVGDQLGVTVAEGSFDARVE